MNLMDDMEQDGHIKIGLRTTEVDDVRVGDIILCADIDIPCYVSRRTEKTVWIVFLTCQSKYIYRTCFDIFVKANHEEERRLRAIDKPLVKLLCPRMNYDTKICYYHDRYYTYNEEAYNGEEKEEVREPWKPEQPPNETQPPNA